MSADLDRLAQEAVECGDVCDRDDCDSCKPDQEDA